MIWVLQNGTLTPTEEENFPPKSACCCFTGHRNLPGKSIPLISYRLEQEIKKLINNEGVVAFFAGGARGFDMLAEETILSLKDCFPEIKLYLALPFPGQADKWSFSEKKKYEDFLTNCDWAGYLFERETKGCMHVRNRYLVDHCEYCISYQTKDEGGTAYTTSYAKKQGLSVINISNEKICFFKQQSLLF